MLVNTSPKRKNKILKRYLNKKFGRLKIINLFFDNNVLMADCICDCGNIKTINAYNIWVGKTKSCGCLREENRMKIIQKIPKSDYAKIIEEYNSNKKMTYQEIANRYGVTKQNICRIVKGR